MPDVTTVLTSLGISLPASVITAGMLALPAVRLISGKVTEDFFSRKNEEFKNDLVKKLEEKKSELQEKLEARKTVLQKELETERNILAGELERVKTELSVTKEVLSRYASKQFDTINEAWSALVEIDIAMDSLWKNADEQNLEQYKKVREKTRLAIAKSALYIEPAVYMRMKQIIVSIIEYEGGKGDLISTKNSPPCGENGISLRSLVQNIKPMIEANRFLRDEFKGLLNEVLPMLIIALKGM